MGPSKRFIKNAYIASTGVFTGVLILICLIEGFWIFHAPPLTLLIVELLVIGAAAVGALAGWFILRRIYPQLRGKDEKLVIDRKVPADTIKEMSVEYELDIDDALAFHLYHRWHSPQMGRVWRLLRRTLLFTIIIEILIAIVLIIAVGKDMLPFSVALGILAILTFLYYIFSPFTSRKTLRWAVAKDYGQGRNKLIGKHGLSITPDAVTDITDMGETTTRWNAIEYVASTDQYIFMSVRASSPYIIPRRAFADDATFQQLVEAAKACHQVAIAQLA